MKNNQLVKVFFLGHRASKIMTLGQAKQLIKEVDYFVVNNVKYQFFQISATKPIRIIKKVDRKETKESYRHSFEYVGRGNGKTVSQAIKEVLKCK